VESEKRLEKFKGGMLLHGQAGDVNNNAYGVIAQPVNEFTLYNIE